VSTAEVQAFYNAVGLLLLALFFQKSLHICSSALGVSTETVDNSSGYLSRSVLQIDPASHSYVMRCGIKALKPHNTLRGLKNRP